VSNLLVMKFGGTSMGSAERIRVAAKLTAEQAAKRPVAIVVSAMSKVTDLLLETLRRAEAGESAAIETNLEALKSRHLECCRELLPPMQHDDAIRGIEELIGEFSRIAHGMLLLRERPLQSVDQAVSVGERLSAFLIAEFLKCEGVQAEAVYAS
jgi:aspartokinase/homoserine dehydrogenase 1